MAKIIEFIIISWIGMGISGVNAETPVFGKHRFNGVAIHCAVYAPIGWKTVTSDMLCAEAKKAWNDEACLLIGDNTVRNVAHLVITLNVELSNGHEVATVLLYAHQDAARYVGPDIIASHPLRGADDEKRSDILPLAALVTYFGFQCN